MSLPFSRAALARASAVLPPLNAVSLVLLGLHAGPARAESLQPAPVDAEHVGIPEIIVTANPLQRTADELIQPAVVLGGEELNRLRRGTLGETLESQPGVATTDFGAGAGRPVIRGLAGPRVEMLENGISAMDVSDLSPDHAVTISPAQAQQIEILKGPATLLYGNGASAGVVNVSNRRLSTQRRDGTSGYLDAGFGDNGDARTLSGEVNLGRGAQQWHADAGWREANDYEIAETAGVDGSGSRGRLANSAVREASGALGYSQVGDNGDAYGFAASHTDSRYGLPVEESAFIDLRQTRFDAQALLLKPHATLESLRLRAAAADYEHSEFEAPGELGTRFENRELQLRVEATHVPRGGVRGVLGMQLSERDFSAIGEEAYVPSVRTREAGVFVLDELPLQRGRLEFGARIDHSEHVPELGTADRDFTTFSLAFGGVLDVNDDTHLKLYLTHAERAPMPEELYAFGPHAATATFERGRLDAKQEVANNIELGFDHHRGAWHFDASVFYNRIGRYLYLAEADAGLNADGSGVASSDGIADRVDEEGVFAADGELLLVDYRQADAALYGIEAEVRYALPSFGPVQTYLRAFGDQVRAELDDGGNLPRIPPMRLGLGIDAHLHEVGVSLEYLRVARQRDRAALESPTAAYRLLNADLDWRLLYDGDTQQSLVLSLRGRNLLDEDVRRATSFIKDAAPAPGRALSLGLRWQF